MIKKATLIRLNTHETNIKRREKIQGNSHLPHVVSSMRKKSEENA